MSAHPYLQASTWYRAMSYFFGYDSASTSEVSSQPESLALEVVTDLSLDR